MPILASATSLADKLAFPFRSAADSFAVGDLGASGLGLDLELAEKAVTDDLEMQFAHTSDNGLAGLLVTGDLKGRILLGKPLQADRHLFLVSLGLGLDGHGDDWFREGGWFEAHIQVAVTKGVASDNVLSANDSADVSRVGDINIFAGISLHDHETAHTLGLSGPGIV